MEPEKLNNEEKLINRNKRSNAQNLKIMQERNNKSTSQEYTRDLPWETLSGENPTKIALYYISKQVLQNPHLIIVSSSLSTSLYTNIYRHTNTRNHQAVRHNHRLKTMDPYNNPKNLPRGLLPPHPRLVGCTVLRGVTSLLV